MGKGSRVPAAPPYRVVKSSRFKEEANHLFGAKNKHVQKAIEVALSRKPFLGQKVKDSAQLVWPVFDGGTAYLTFYRISGAVVHVDSVIRREPPLSPKALGLED